jgi:hypothetical protein
MTPARLRLKRPAGWFAAGQEVGAALEVLSGDAFKLYVYLCLNAERQTGRFAGKPDNVARLFQSAEQSQVAWEELFRHCQLRIFHAAFSAVQISEWALVPAL